MIMSKEERLKIELKYQIKRFGIESTRHKKMYRCLRYSTFVLTGLATVLASLALQFAETQGWINIAIVVVTATAGILASIEGLRKPSELWINERNVLYALIDLQREVEYEAAENGNLKNTDEYFTRLQQILGVSKEKWTNLVSVKSEKP
jgi:hypothetical protein